ncbi:MAG: hypothetical protein ACI39F_00825 [Acutalibacteraceae bacterium]
MRKLIGLTLSLLMVFALIPVAMASAETSTLNGDESVWVYVGNPNGSSASITYTKDSYADGTDALQAAFDDYSAGKLSLSGTTSVICINQDITLTKQVTFCSASANSVLRLYNDKSLTYSPTDTENATTAIKSIDAIDASSVYTLVIFASTSTMPEKEQFVAYNGNTFFENLAFQFGGKINGDISIKDPKGFANLGSGYGNPSKISGNLIFTGTATTSSDKAWGTTSYKVDTSNNGTLTIGGKLDYSGVTSGKDKIASLASSSAITITGGTVSEEENSSETSSNTSTTTTTTTTTTTGSEVDTSNLIYDNFFYLYNSNGFSGAEWESGTAGSVFSSAAHGMYFPDTTALWLKQRTDLSYDTTSNVLNIDWTDSQAGDYFLPTGRYKLIVLEYVPKGVAGEYKFSAYELDKSATSLSGGTATELSTVNFASATPYASYVDGKVKAFEIGEFDLKDGANNGIAITAEQVSGNIFYCCGVAAVPADGEITDAISTKSTASIRLGATVNGIRFYTTVDETKLKELIGDSTDYEYGTLIGPKDKINGVLTFEDVDANNAVDVQFLNKDAFYTEGSGDDSFKGIVGSLVGIKEEKTSFSDYGNVPRDFVARGYVRVGDTYYYSSTTATRSLGYIASQYIADGNSNDNATRWASVYEAYKKATETTVA